MNFITLVTLQINRTVLINNYHLPERISAADNGIMLAPRGATFEYNEWQKVSVWGPRIFVIKKDFVERRIHLKVSENTREKGPALWGEKVPVKSAMSLHSVTNLILYIFLLTGKTE